MGWSLDGTRLYVASTDGVVATWDTANGSLLDEVFFRGSGVTAFALSPDATRYAVLGGDDRVSIVYLTTNQVIVMTEGDPSINLGDVVWHPNGSQVAGVSINLTHVWDTTTGERLYSQVHSLDQFEALDYGPNGALTFPDDVKNFVLGPIPEAGSDQTVTDGDSNGSQDVTLDGSGSSDSDGTIVSYSWQENGVEIATGVNPTVDVAVGVHTITLVVTDDDGATGIDTVVIEVLSAGDPTPTPTGTSTPTGATTPAAHIRDYPTLVDTDGISTEPVTLPQ
ncbi:MAG: hypothetical protein OHK0046_42040 [Anaerolineae bacterium]